MIGYNDCALSTRLVITSCLVVAISQFSLDLSVVVLEAKGWLKLQTTVLARF